MTRHICNTHRQYALTCDEYDHLARRAAGSCERCAAPSAALQIDHDHALGVSAVRGLVCQPCNLELVGVDSGKAHPTSRDRAYLGGAWHREAKPTARHEPDRRTPVRHIRVDNELYGAVRAKVAERRETVAAVIKRALLAYVEEK